MTAYLAGVKKEHFSDITGHLQIEVYNKTDKNRYAKIIRNLCILRNTLLKNYYEINERITKKYQSFYSMTDIIPQDVIMFLSNERINPFKGNRPTLYSTVVELNRLVSDRLNNALVILTMIQSYLDTNFQLNIQDLYEDIIKKAYIELDPVEKQQLYDRHIKTISMELSKDGQLRLKIKK